MLNKVHSLVTCGLALTLAIVPITGCSGKQASTTTEATSASATSGEKKQVDVPNVVGMTSEEAHAALWALNLQDEIMSTNGSSAEASSHWKVTQQNPEAGKAAQEGDVVKLMVEGQGVGIPDVVGMRCDRASEALEKAGLKEDIKSDSGKTVVLKSNWTVIGQEPAAGTEAKAGDTVTITVSKDGAKQESTKQDDTSEESKSAEESKATEESADKQSDERPMAKDSKYSVTIDGSRIIDSYDGSPCIAVDFTFSNVSDDDATSMMIATDITAYQNGAECEMEFFADESVDNYSAKVKKGSSLPVTLVFSLQDTSTEVEVEVEENSFWSHDLLAYAKLAIA